MSLAMDLADLWVCGGKIAPMDVIFFSVDVAFARHFVATHPTTPTLPPYRNARGIGYASKKLAKFVGNSASYPLNSWWTDT